MTTLDQCLQNVLELPVAVSERRQELWAQLEQAYASSPPLPLTKSFKVWIQETLRIETIDAYCAPRQRQAIADKQASADNIVYRLNSVARAFHVTPAVLVDFFGSQAILNRNPLDYLRTLRNLRPATTFLELLAAFERKRRFDELMAPAKALKQVVQSRMYPELFDPLRGWFYYLDYHVHPTEPYSNNPASAVHPNAASTRQSRKRAAATSASPLQGSEIPPAAAHPASAPELRESEASKQGNFTPKPATENTTTAEQSAFATPRTSTPEPFKEADWPQASPSLANSMTTFPIPGPDQEPLRIQDSTILSTSPGRLFDTSLGDFDSTNTSGGLDLTTFEKFLGSVNTSSTPHKPKTTVDNMASHWATTHLQWASKRALSRVEPDAALAPKRSRHDPDAVGSSGLSSLRVPLEAIAESWHRLDKDWLDDVIVNLAIS
ncbi:hypothetical protein CH35J_010987 [Colletotrichum higginsianum]|uniref:Uncharacterized protein n=1 Tax=Colletotrichum higginsianum TaxID=80884 RepID=A0A4V4NAE5_9PEZI|nr:hypothetical protein CH35J_010987 [Colletotrichum higginsianum]